MMRLATLLLTVALASCLATVARGDTVDLRSGGTIVATARLEGPDDFVIDAVLPRGGRALSVSSEHVRTGGGTDS